MAWEEAVLSDIISELETVVVKGGEVVVRRGDPSDDLLLVVSGRLRVVLEAPETGSERVLAELGRGETVGEAGLITGDRRSATVYAIRDAILARLTSQQQPPDRQVGGLAPWQLRRVLEYLDTHFSQRVELATLARLVDLSQSHFSHAFKVSTGVAPYRWQLDARIRRAQRLLLETRRPLEQVAEATGFADAVHFGRTFRRLTGTPPAAWRDGHP